VHGCDPGAAGSGTAVRLYPTLPGAAAQQLNGYLCFSPPRRWEAASTSAAWKVGRGVALSWPLALGATHPIMSLETGDQCQRKPESVLN
jgi:hypothetical protein